MKIIIVFLLFALNIFAYPYQPGSCGGPNNYNSITGNLSASPHAGPLQNNNFWSLLNVPTIYNPGSQYTIRLDGTNATVIFGVQENRLAGFLFAAIDSNGIGVGSWSDTNGYVQQLVCGTQAAVTPTNANFVIFSVSGGVIGGHTFAFNNLTNPPDFVSVKWTAPTAGTGTVTIGAIAVIDVLDSFVTPIIISSQMNNSMTQTPYIFAIILWIATILSF